MEKTVGRCCVVVEWGSGEYEQIVVDAWTEQFVAPNLSGFVRMTVIYQFLDKKIIWVKFPGFSLPHPD